MMQDTRETNENIEDIDLNEDDGAKKKKILEVIRCVPPLLQT